MAAVPTTQASLAAVSRCHNRPWLSAEEPNVDYQPDKADASILEKVDRALWDHDVLRSTDYDQIDVHVKGGVVFLSGHVISTTNQQSAENAARQIPGVVGVRNELVADDKIKRDVAAALGKIEQAYGVKFFTGAQHGVIVLNGEVNSASINLRSAAEKCAAEIPGVRGVVNSVRYPGFKEAEDQRFLQPRLGASIHFRDGLSGKVHRVVIDPDNRRVVAMVIRGRNLSSQQDHGVSQYAEKASPERYAVIPIRAIRHLTQDAGFIDLDNAEATGVYDFDPTGFTVPSDEWVPPYPYCSEEVLFPVEPVEVVYPAESKTAQIPVMLPVVQPVILPGSPQ